MKRSSCSHSQKLYFLLSPYNSVKQKILINISFLLSHACQIRKKNAIFLTKIFPLIASALISHLYKPQFMVQVQSHSPSDHTPVSGVKQPQKCCSFRNFPLSGHILGSARSAPAWLMSGSSRSHTLLLCAMQLCPQGVCATSQHSANVCIHI